MVRRWLIGMMLLSAVAVPALPVAASSAPSSYSGTRAVVTQSIAYLRLTQPWDLRRSTNLAIQPDGQTWAGVTVMGELPPGQTYAHPAPTLMALSAGLACPLAGCGPLAKQYVEANALKVLRPGRYVIVVYGPEKAHPKVTVSGFAGSLTAFRPLPTGSDVVTTHGTGPADHHVALDRHYDITATHGHTLSGYLYRAAVQQPGQEVLLVCANSRAPVREASGPHACGGTSFVLGPSVPHAATDVTVDGWFSFGNINPAYTATGDGQFYAEAHGPATDLLLLDWQLVLPF
jgi:hypothetical protein